MEKKILFPVPWTAKIKENTNSFLIKCAKDYKRNKGIYLLFLPVALYFIVFHYIPMIGTVIAFKDYAPFSGILRSPWVGMSNFKIFITSEYFVRVLKNTLILSFYGIIFGFPAPLMMSLLINELKNIRFKSFVQTVSYMPHFISLVVICGIIKDFTSESGIITHIVSLISGRQYVEGLLQLSSAFRPIYILSGIWQETGWGTIIYLAALSGINQNLYEAAMIDGAGRWKQTIHITIPGISPTIIVLLILRIGSIMNIGFEKVILLYSPMVYNTADVISSYVYRKGILEHSWSFSTAVGLFNSVINTVLLLGANFISRKFNQYSIW